MKDFKVEAIIDGTVIDHIPDGKAIVLIKIFRLNGKYCYLTGSGLTSKKSPNGKKDIIKIEGKEFSQEEINILALIAPNVTVSIIRDKKIINKMPVKLPERVSDVIVCNNPKCITNNDKYCKTEFVIVKRGDKVFLKCKYCEKEYSIEDLKILL